MHTPDTGQAFHEHGACLVIGCTACLAGRQAAHLSRRRFSKRSASAITFFIDLPSEAGPGSVATLALWSLLTYCYQAWDAIPYLYVGGPHSSGKTRVFEILERLVFRPLATSNLTAPALFRSLHDRGGTLLLDEARRLKQPTPDQQELLGMLLAGYKRGGQATRLETDTFRMVTFDVYGPKALACIAGLPPTLASRSITLMMFRAGPGSPNPGAASTQNPSAGSGCGTSCTPWPWNSERHG